MVTLLKKIFLWMIIQFCEFKHVYLVHCTCMYVGMCTWVHKWKLQNIRCPDHLFFTPLRWSLSLSLRQGLSLGLERGWLGSIKPYWSSCLCSVHWSYRCEHPDWLFIWCQVLNSGPSVYATITLHWVISPAPVSSYFWFLNCPHLQPQTCLLSVVLPRHRFKICNLLCRVSFSYYLFKASINLPSLSPSLSSFLPLPSPLLSTLN